MSPLANQRDDAYGGSLAHRMRFPLEVFEAVRAAFPEDRPVGVRVSATDWMDHGWDLEQTIALAREPAARGADWIDVSSGGISPAQKIALGPGYQVLFAEVVKRATGLPTRAVGLITTPAQAEGIVANGKANLVALARAMLYDPRWPWHAAAEFGATVDALPQYWRSAPAGHLGCSGTRRRVDGGPSEACMTGHGRVAIITGAGRGIGKATALAFLRDGYRVALAGRHRDTLDATAAESRAGDRALVIPADVTDPGAVDALFDAVRQAFGRLDVLFNNAGTGARPVSIDELTVAEWRRVVDTNLTGTFLCARAAFRLMKDQDPRGGRIINNGSISAHAPRPRSAPYTATKHAITGLTKSLSLDGRPHDIACGQIDIGNALTEMTAPMASGVPQADGSVRPEPTIDVAHIANAVLHMANLPLDANVQFMTIMATKMPFVGRG